MNEKTEKQIYKAITNQPKNMRMLVEETGYSNATLNKYLNELLHKKPICKKTFNGKKLVIWRKIKKRKLK